MFNRDVQMNGKLHLYQPCSRKKNLSPIPVCRITPSMSLWKNYWVSATESSLQVLSVITLKTRRCDGIKILWKVVCISQVCCLFSTMVKSDSPIDSLHQVFQRAKFNKFYMTKPSPTFHGDMREIMHVCT